MAAQLVHGTALVTGTTGLLLLGPSGAGKSAIALELMESARLAGHFAALISDDQVLVEKIDGQILATAPASIRGLIEIRGTGIGRVAFVDSAILDLALSIESIDSANRMPESERTWQIGPDLALPLLTLDRHVRAPFAVLSAMIDAFPLAQRRD